MNSQDMDAIATIMLPESVDSTSAASVEEMITRALRPGGRVIVDGSATSYMSAAGVRTFATVYHRAAEQQARIVFCRFTGAAADCLLVSGFSRLFDVAESMAEAQVRLQGRDARSERGGLRLRGGTG